MIPAISCMWAITILFEKPLLSMGLNLLLIIPGVLVANTPLWIVYPYCYSGYVVSNALHTVTATDTGSTLSLFPFIPCAVIISVFAICVSIKYFGRKEMSWLTGKMPAYAGTLPKRKCRWSLKYRIYRHLLTYEKIIRNFMYFYYNSLTSTTFPSLQVLSRS